MASRREILQSALDRWRSEGAIDEDTHMRLTDRVVAEADAPSDGTPDEAASRMSAGRATQFVGGLLVGAALVALAFFLGFEDEGARWAFLLMGAAAVAGGIFLSINAGELRRGLADALLAAGLVPIGMAAGLGFDDTTPIIGILAAAIAIAVHVLIQGRGPVIMLCVAIVSLASFTATARLFTSVEAASTASWLAVLLGYLALTLVWRANAWSSAAAGALLIPITIAFVLLIDDIIPSARTMTYQLLVGLLLGAFFALGLYIGVRGLVAVSAAGLTIDAVYFAADLGGAGTAVVVLLLLGGLLVWQGAGIRAYFRRPPKHEGL